MTFTLSAEEMAFMVKEADKCGVQLLKPFVTHGYRSCDFFQNFVLYSLFIIKERNLGNSGSKNCPNEWPF